MNSGATHSELHSASPVRSLPLLSLFSGAGGFDLGFEAAGFSPRLAIDIDEAAIETYNSNRHSGTAIQVDLSQEAPTTIAQEWENRIGATSPIGIIGGSPCQGFSVSNVHQLEDDPRRILLIHYSRIIENLAQHYEIDFFVFENVPGLLHKRHQKFFFDFKRNCEKADFYVQHKILNAVDFEVPQFRKRLIVFGINQNKYSPCNFQFAKAKQPPRTVREALQGLPEPEFCIRGARSYSSSHHPNHITMVPRSPKFTDGSLKHGMSKGLSFRVLNWDRPSYTVAYGHNEIHVHPSCRRRLSVYEAMLLQGFPSDYKLYGTFTQQVQQVSNAVPPPLAQGIAKLLVNRLYSGQG